MKNSLNKLTSLYSFDIRSYKYLNKACLIDTRNGKFILKKKKEDSHRVFDYLLSRNFEFFLYPEDIRLDDTLVYSYIDEIKMPDSEKAVDLMYIMASLHNKTTSFSKLSMDKIKSIYEEKVGNFEYLFNYYNDLEESINMRVYPAPWEYNLLINISKVYDSLMYGRKLIEKWYSSIKDEGEERQVFLHNHISLEHFLVGKEEKLINFDYSKHGCPIYDFLYFYGRHYKELDIISLFSIYQNKYPFLDNELLLFFVELLDIPKIKFEADSYVNNLMVYNLVTYLDFTREFILKNQKKKQKANENEFSEEN